MMNKKAILCVDDEAIIVFSIKQELKSHFGNRFLYETALNAENALKIVRELASDGISLILVISDWLMPGMKGDEFLRHIRNENPQIRTIMITGHATQEAIAQVREEHLADALLIKPWKSRELLDVIDEFLSEKNIS